MTFCKDCIWCDHWIVVDETRTSYWYCRYGQKTQVDEISGDEWYTGKDTTCYEARRSAFCGGRHYRRKWWKFWAKK